MATKKSVQNAKRRAARRAQAAQSMLPTPTTYHNIFATPDGKVIKWEPLSGHSWMLQHEGWKFIPTLTAKA